MNASVKRTLSNTFMLYLLTFAKMIIPLVTLPYLTRVLSAEAYGTVSYVKSVIAYTQLVVDFGFIISSTKDIVDAAGNRNKINEIVSSTILARLLLSIFAIAVGIILSFVVPILSGYFVYVFLSLLVPLMSSFYLDVLFRGIEKMHYISVIYVIAHVFGIVFTFALVKNDEDILFIPIINILSAVITLLVSWIICNKLRYKLIRVSLHSAIEKIKGSFVFFVNKIASTAFGALNTVFIGIAIPDLSQVAYWSVVMQLVGAVQSLYTPISDGIFPYMVKTKNIKFLLKTVFLILPVVILGCMFCYEFSPDILRIICGEKYISADKLFRSLVPVLLFSYPVAILGTSGLGAIGKMRYVTISTIVAASVQVLGLAILAIFKCASIYFIAYIRVFTELLLLVFRSYYTYKNRKSFTM